VHPLLSGAPDKKFPAKTGPCLCARKLPVAPYHALDGGLLKTGPGPAVELYNVKGTGQASAHNNFGLAQTAFANLGNAWYHRTTEQDCREQAVLAANGDYANEIVKCLCNLLLSQSQISPITRAQIAIVTPSTFDVASGILDAVRQKAEAAAGEAWVSLLVDVEVSVFKKNRLYFGAAANVAGLERNYVLTVGFLHPHNRVEKWGMGYRWDTTKVDPEMYLAATRCTYQLCIIEFNALWYSKHQQITKAGDSYISTDSDGFDGAAFIDDAESLIYLPVVVDFKHAFRDDDVLKIASITVKIPWEHSAEKGRSSFPDQKELREKNWAACLPQLRELWLGDLLKLPNSEGYRQDASGD
jgi:hypothetical protein